MPLGLLHLLLLLTRHICSNPFQRRHVCICIGVVFVPLGVRQLCIEVALKVGPLITKRRVQVCKARYGWVIWSNRHRLLTWSTCDARRIAHARTRTVTRR